MRKLNRLLMATLLLVPLAACDEGNNNVTPEPEPPAVGTVSGTVTVEGSGLAGVNVALAGAAAQSTTSAADGSYSFSNVLEGNYSVTISGGPDDVVFSQTSQSVTINQNGQVASADFSGSYVRTASVLVSVMLDGNGVATSVRIQGTGVDQTLGTNANGSVQFTGLRKGTYTVSLTTPPEGFDLTSQSVQLNTGQSAQVNFVGESAPTSTIIVLVTKDGEGLPIAVNLTGTGVDQTLATDAGGQVAFTGLEEGTYNVALVSPPADVEFDETDQDVTVGRGETALVNFVGTKEIVPADVSIGTITAVVGGVVVPVTLTAVAGQIEVALNITRNDETLDHVDVLIGDRVVATQTFASAAPLAALGDQEVVTLSVPTTQVRMGSGGQWVPTIYNGGTNLHANLYTVENPAAPRSTQDVAIVMTNPDGILPGNAVGGDLAFAPDSPPGVLGAGPATWYAGSATLTGPIYLAYGTNTPTSVTWPSVIACGAVTSAIGGTAAAGITVGNTYACTGVEGAVLPTYAAPAVTVAALGPDGTAVVAPTGISALGADFTLEGETRRFVIPPAMVVAGQITFPTALMMDNKAPAVNVDGEGVGPGAAHSVAFDEAFDFPWINSQTYDFWSNRGNGAVATDGTDQYVVDGGVGTDASVTTVDLWVAGAPGSCSGGTIATVGSPNPTSLGETQASDGSPDGYQVCVFGADLLGNSTTSGPSNFFGVDNVAAAARLHGHGPDVIAGTVPIAGPSGYAGPLSLTPLSGTMDNTYYSVAGTPIRDASGTVMTAPLTYTSFDGTMTWGLEALDTRSGLDQAGLVTGFPAMQSITHTGFAGVTTACATTFTMGTVLTDNYVRTDAEDPFICTYPDPGYYEYHGWVVDRAGNASTSFDYNWLIDDNGAAAITLLSFATTFYAPGTDASFTLFGGDDLEVIDATLTLEYPSVIGLLSMQDDNRVGTRWDYNPFVAGNFTNAITGLTVVIEKPFGRVDFTCSAAGVPYATCPGLDGITPASAEYNVGVGDASMLPTSVTATSMVDAGGNISGGPEGFPLAVPFIPAQWNASTPEPWTGADPIITWRIFEPVAGDLKAEHATMTSVDIPVFDRVALYRLSGATAVYCGDFPAPIRTDSGLTRFFTYSMSEPVAGTRCGDLAGTWHAVGIIGNAALATQGIP